MAHHDIDYDMDMSDDENEDLNTRNSRSTNPSRLQDPGKAKATSKDSASGNRARWEAGAQKNWDLHEGDDGNLTSVLGGMEEATKRLRLQKDTTPLQRGIIRHCLLVLDLSIAMTEKDLRPTRFLLTLTYTIAFVREFFEQNPISQLGILGMRDGLAVRISELSGNPNDHITALKELRKTEPKGAASLQNALDMARAALYHTPSHGTREVVIILGALSSSDPGDIHQTINACVRDKLRVTVIGLAAQMHICADLCARTNAGDTGSYNVALDEPHYRELLMAITTPPVMRQTSSTAATRRLTFAYLPLTAQMQIRQEVMESVPDNEKMFTVYIKDDNLMIFDGPSLALTDKIHIVEIDISSTYEGDDLYYVAQHLRQHDFLMDSIKHSPYHNVLITSWHKPQFFGLVHLSYWHARFAQEFRRKGIRPLALGEIAHGFGNQSAVSYTIEQILDIGIQHMGSLNFIETLATRIFRYLHGHPLANNE
ncbi:transcription initiation factor TFIIH subunit H2, variant, partial [Aureobasidium melanogenum]